MSVLIDSLFPDFAAENASTRRILERYPDGKGAWKPHEKSRALAPLATHVADIVNRGTMVLETDSMDIVGRQPMAPIDSGAELVRYFDESAARFMAVLGQANGTSLERPWAIRRGDTVLRQGPRRVFLRTLVMSHLVHHRAQLGVYYRLLDIPVPGVYGPSADEPIG